MGVFRSPDPQGVFRSPEKEYGVMKVILCRTSQRDFWFYVVLKGHEGSDKF